MAKQTKVLIRKYINKDGFWVYVYKNVNDVSRSQEATLELKKLLHLPKSNEVKASIAKYKAIYNNTDSKEFEEIGKEASFTEKYAYCWHSTVV